MTHAVGDAALLLSALDAPTRIPAAPPYERGKRPADVHRRLSNCYQTVSRIARRSGI